MSDDGKKPEEPDDDGWGAAADVVQEKVVPETEPASSSEWQDPVNLDEKVAALRASEHKTASQVSKGAEETLGEAPDVAIAPESATAAPEEAEHQNAEFGEQAPENPAAPPQEAPPIAELPEAGSEEAGSEDATEMGALSTTEPSTDDVASTDDVTSTDDVASTDDVMPASPLPSTSVNDEDAPQWSATPPPGAPTEAQPMPAPSDPKAKKRKEPRERSASTGLTRKQTIRLIAGAVLLVLTGVGAILGWLNSQNYYLVCGTKSIRAEQGRFWPTGQNSLSGPAFRPISVPSDVLCQSTSFEDREELELAFLDALLAQSTKLLTSGGSEQVSVAEAQLEQALLLTREPERAEQRELAERLQGDVSYWRGAAEIQRAAEVLQVGATSFEQAAGKRPRHSSDAQAWAEHARFIAEEIDKGPRSLREDEAPKEKPYFSGLTTPTAALKAPSDGGSVPVVVPQAPPIDAGVPTPPPADADVPPVDAALPRGGVLL